MILFSTFPLISLYDFSLSLLLKPFRYSQVDEGEKSVFPNTYNS